MSYIGKMLGRVLGERMGLRERMGKGENDGLRTVECLRGRLLAERVASKAAKEEAELMSRRLLELERLLVMETKSKNRAEKRLRYALKKLESLKLLDISRNAVEGSSESFSSTCSSKFQVPEEQEQKSESPSQSAESGQCANSVRQFVPQEGNWSSVHFHKEGDPCWECKNSLHSGKTTTLAMSHSSICGEEFDDVRHQRACPNDARTRKSQIDSDVQSVLVALRHVKEQLQSSMRRRAAERTVCVSETPTRSVKTKEEKKIYIKSNT